MLATMLHVATLTTLLLGRTTVDSVISLRRASASAAAWQNNPSHVDVPQDTVTWLYVEEGENKSERPEKEKGGLPGYTYRTRYVQYKRPPPIAFAEHDGG